MKHYISRWPSYQGDLHFKCRNNAERRGGGVSGHLSISFVPLMAREGSRLGVGGERNRGGLLSSASGLNIIQQLAGKVLKDYPAFNEYDRKRAQVLEELRNLNLLTKDDIEEYQMVFFSLYSECQRRFDFFTSWNPECLKPRDSPSMPTLIHFAVGSRAGGGNEKSFEMAFKAGMKYFPEHLGFLFCKWEQITAIKKTFDKFGVDKAMNIIRKGISPSDNHLILHRAIEDAPDLVDAIAQYYPDAVFLRDSNDHTFMQSKFYIYLQRGRKTFKKKSTFFLGATDDQVNRVDPKTGLCPFMLAAVDNKSD